MFLAVVGCEGKRSEPLGGAPTVRSLKTGDNQLTKNTLDFVDLERGGAQSRKLRFKASVAGDLRLKVALNGLGHECEAKGKYSENYEIRYTYLMRDPKTGLFTVEVMSMNEPMPNVLPHFMLAAGEELQIVVELLSMCNCESAQVEVEASFTAR